MVNVRMALSIRSGFSKTIRKLAPKVTRLELNKKVKSLQSLITNSINNSVEEDKILFIPSNRQAEELGVGSNGSIDNQKLQSAWQILKIPNGGLEFNFDTINFSGLKLGTISVSLDRDILFNAVESIIDTPDSREISEIPWMRWFIEGKTISGTRFSSRSPVSEASRTGGGVMIKGGLWDFPDNELNIVLLLNKIRDNLIVVLKSDGVKILEG